MPILKAEEALESAQVGALPYMSESDRGRTVREWRQTANAKHHQVVMQPEMAKTVLALMGIGLDIEENPQ